MRVAAVVAMTLSLAMSAAARPAHAAIDRYAVIVGNNEGGRDEPRLRFAETDASKLRDALGEIGGFPAENLLLLQGERVAAVRGAVIATNDRVRESLAASRQALLVVYYSGHADAEALHLGEDRLPLRELEQLVRGSAANVRLLIVDACRSGALTQAKGGVRAPPFPVQIEQRLAGEGAIFLTSSAVNEDAQESDAIGGSFFTHYLVSGLLGAADHDEDGLVSLEEAYRFAYDSTLKASSRSLSGTQHPTYHYDIRGQGSLALTSPFVRASERAEVRFPAGLGFLLMRDGPDGGVVAEVGATQQLRRLSLKPGRYFVRGRSRDYLLEGVVRLTAGQVATVREEALERVQYARLVRRGGSAGGSERPAFAVEGGYLIGSSIWSGGTACQGGFVGPTAAFSRLTLGARFGGCRSRDRREQLEAQVEVFDLQARLWLEWDLDAVAVGLGLGAGAALLHQRFETTGRAPARWSAGAELGLAARTIVPLGRRPFLLFELEAQTLLVRRQQDQGAPDELGALSGVRALLGAGAHLW
jgi:hypothetical protein